MAVQTINTFRKRCILTRLKQKIIKSINSKNVIGANRPLRGLDWTSIVQWWLEESGWQAWWSGEWGRRGVRGPAVSSIPGKLIGSYVTVLYRHIGSCSPTWNFWDSRPQELGHCIQLFFFFPFFFFFLCVCVCVWHAEYFLACYLQGKFQCALWMQFQHWVQCAHGTRQHTASVPKDSVLNVALRYPCLCQLYSLKQQQHLIFVFNWTIIYTQ